MISILDTIDDYARVYTRLQQGNRHETLLYSSETASFEDFRSLVKQGWAIEVSYEIPTTVAWIDTFNGTTAFIHFCYYKGAENYTNQAMVDVLDWAFDIGQRTTLFGITPKVYRHVFKAITQPAGFSVLFEEPNMCYMAKHDKYVPGVVTRLNVETWKYHRQALLGGFNARNVSSEPLPAERR